ncbi:MAG: hypothetical protein JSS75_05955 [Bacteroidetes bacterium]|nr:hypothetical protein [Bacteroidota bacterium]
MPSRIELELFADEIKNVTCSTTGERWSYIGILAVPSVKKQSLLKRLHHHRELIHYHGELHGKKLTSNDKMRLAKSWLKEVVFKDAIERSVYFSILGINQSNINTDAFGDKEFDNMYNRLFRATIVGLLHIAFDKQALKVVKDIYHDNANIESHEYFSWHVPYHIDRNQPDIAFECQEITFIDSDHRKSQSDNSHLIQLTDLLLAGTSQCLDYTSHQDHKVELGRTMYPLVKRMLRSPWNHKSSYGHSRKFMVSFFPRKKLSHTDLENELYRGSSAYYLDRELVFDEKGHGQENLFS